MDPTTHLAMTTGRQVPAREIRTAGGELASAAPPERTRATAQQSFAAVLGQKRDVIGAVQTAESRAREAAQGLVAQTFIQPLLKQLRSSTWAKPPFAPTQAEKQFRSLMDVELSQRMVEAGRFPLVDRLARDMLERAGALASAREALSTQGTETTR